jgi:hypothetical protein
MRQWDGWVEHTGPIGLGGVELTGAKRRFGKNINVHSNDVGGLLQYENGQLSIGGYLGATLANQIYGFGGGGYLTIGFGGCGE